MLLKVQKDALTDFLTTGKLSFRDFTESLLKDIARIALQQTLIKGLMAIMPGAGVASSIGGDTSGMLASSSSVMQGLSEPASFEPTNITPLTMPSMASPTAQQTPVNINVNTTVNANTNAGMATNNADPDQAKLLANEISQTIKSEVVQVIYEQQRPGGALYR